jgi:GNAT superfamily N-acetyltransferase
VPKDLFAESRAAFLACLSGQMGCDARDYESEASTVVMRPPDSREHHLALATTFGTGTVVSVRDERLADWVRAHPPEPHFRAFLPSFLESFAAAARDLGYATARSHSASGGMVLAEERPTPELPHGYRLREIEAEEQAALRSTRTFDNALAEPDEHDRIAHFRTAFVIESPGGEIAAMAGIWDQYPGIDEIGVDVVRDFRGKGLSTAATLHAVHWIRANGRWPIYTYGFTNVRSMNNGLASGFRPAWFLAAVLTPES